MILTKTELSLLSRLSNTSVPGETYLEACARRMTATLARKPRAASTSAYIASLPKRKPLVIVPADFIPPRIPQEHARELARVVIDRNIALSEMFQPVRVEHSFLEPQLAPVRKDRMRPKAEMQKMRYRLVEAQHGRCGGCGGRLGDYDATIDHVIPKALGGPNHQDNYLAMHSVCNNKKADRMPNEFELSMNSAKNARMAVIPPAPAPMHEPQPPASPARHSQTTLLHMPVHLLP